MPGVVKQAQAEQDLVDIWLYTFNEWGEQQADKYLDELAAALNLLAQPPLICRERSEFTPPVRIQHHEHHLIVYLTLSPTGTEITHCSGVGGPVVYKLLQDKN
jgi:toxin ParE1/3/4